ncbi:MAG TPA: hypothetical protein VGC93_03500 [Thermoanaerobaculia bacterium]
MRYFGPRWAPAALLVALACTLTLPLAAGNGNGIPPGQNPFQYLLGLIQNLQDQIDDLGGASACFDVADTIEGTWSVANEGTGTSGQVTFNGDGTYTIDSGTYNAGGSFLGKTSGTYEALDGGAIAFTYQGSSSVDRIAVVQCASEDEIIHFVMGHTHDYEILTRVP